MAQITTGPRLGSFVSGSPQLPGSSYGRSIQERRFCWQKAPHSADATYGCPLPAIAIVGQSVTGGMAADRRPAGEFLLRHIVNQQLRLGPARHQSSSIRAEPEGLVVAAGNDGGGLGRIGQARGDILMPGERLQSRAAQKPKASERPAGVDFFGGWFRRNLLAIPGISLAGAVPCLFCRDGHFRPPGSSTEPKGERGRTECPDAVEFRQSGHW